MAEYISSVSLYNDSGYVRLVDIMPSDRDCDRAVIDAARTSYDGQPSKSSDTSLLRYLMRHRHTTPFEMVEFKWEMQMPIFIARQIIRHRTANVNEVSGRYTELPDNFFFFKELYYQSDSNKQGSSNKRLPPEKEEEFLTRQAQLCDMCYDLYKEMVDFGTSKEQSRIHLNLNICTKWVWKNDLHNTLHLLSLRADSHAQAEARELANAMIEQIKPYAPKCINAWDDYHPMRGAMLFSALELPALKVDETYIPTVNNRELREFHAKAEKLKAIG